MRVLKAEGLNIHDVVRLGDGTVAYVLSHDRNGEIVWLNTSQEVLSIPGTTTVERLLSAYDIAFAVMQHPERCQAIMNALHETAT